MKTRSRCICAVLTLIIQSLASSQQHNSGLEVTIIIQPRLISTSRQAVVVRALAAMTDTSQWHHITVPPDAKLYGLIADRYRFTDRQLEVRDAIADLIVDVNRLPDKNSMREGQTLLMPVLPVKPATTGADSALVQFFRPDSALLVPAKADSVATDSKPTQNRGLEAAASWLIQASDSTFHRFVSALPDSLPLDSFGDAIYVGVPGSFGLFSLPPVSEASRAKEWPALASSNLAGEIRSLTAGQLFLFDFFDREFSNGRSHGAMVEDVALEALRGYGAPQLANNKNVRQVELDFWGRGNRPRPEAVGEIEQYIRSLPSEQQRRTLTGYLRVLEKTSRPQEKGEKYAVPGLYLQALYANRIASNVPVVISSSFSTTFDGVAILPRELLPTHPAILLSAVPNESILKIEELLYNEPQRSYWELAPRYGTVLVGAAVDERTPLGATSKGGSGITAVGRGRGWSGQVIRPADQGTSFATPSLAAALLIAQAYARQTGRPASGLDLSRRLMLAAEVSPAFVGQYASGGIPRIDRLLLPPGTYAVRLDGSVVPVTVESGTIWATNEKGRYRLDFPSPADEEPDLLGFAVRDGGAFVFRPSKRMWVSIHDVELSLSLREGATPHTFGSLSAFTTLYSEILIL